MKNNKLILQTQQGFKSQSLESGIFPKRKQEEGLTSISYHLAHIAKVSDIIY